MRDAHYYNALVQVLVLSLSLGVRQVLSCGEASSLMADSRGSLDLDQYFLGPAPHPSCALFTKDKQGGELCPSYGESQWTGTVTINEGQELFYWFFDSRNDPANDPIILSMAGGPGASSMLNMLRGTGPCALDEDKDSDNLDAADPRPNPWSWNNNASLLFLDQPTGTGFSQRGPDAPLPVREQDTAKDFQRFLNIFFKHVFPDKQHLPIHISTGSYGGHYGPVYLNHILESRRKGSKDAFWGNIESLIMPDAVINWLGLFVGVYTMLCQDFKEPIGLNATACESIANHMEEQKRLGKECESVYLGDVCKQSFDHGVKYIHGPYMEQRRDLADIYRKCPDDAEYPFCKQPAVQLAEEYLNRAHVKKELGLPADFVFSDVNMDIWQAFHDSGAWYSPTTQELINVLNAYTEDKIGDIKVLVLNGNSDFYCNTQGNMWQYDRLPWHGQSEYSRNSFQPLQEEEVAARGSWKATADGRLAFVAIDGAGHFAPRETREGFSRIVNKWLQRSWRM